MKISIKLLSVFITILFYGCNSDIFIKDFIKEIPETCIVENGKEYSLYFDTADWDILNINNVQSDDFKICDLDGNQKNNSLPLENGETAILYFENPYHRFRIEKRNSKELKIICEKNLDNSPICFGIEVGNKYLHKCINVSLNPTDKFIIDKVEYDLLNDFNYSNNVVEQVDYVSVNNSSSDSPVKIGIYPYKNSYRIIEFTSIDYEINNLTKYFGEQLPEIAIPDIEEGKPVIRNTKAIFGTGKQKLIPEKVDKNFIFEVTVPPGEKKNIEVYNEIELLTTNYKIYASNPQTGEKIVFKGTFYSRSPFGYLTISKK